MTRGKKLLLLTAALVLIAIGTLLAIKYLKPKPNIIPMEKGELIFALDDTKLLSWEYNGESFQFDLSTDPWTFLPDESFTISNIAMMDIEKAITQIHSRKSIPLPEDLSQYGLDEPLCTITAGDTVIQVGDLSSLQSQYYVYLGGDRVYMVDQTHIQPFLRSLDALK